MVTLCLLFIITHEVIEKEFFGISLINSKAHLLLCTYQDRNYNFIRPVSQHLICLILRRRWCDAVNIENAGMKDRRMDGWVDNKYKNFLVKKKTFSLLSSNALYNSPCKIASVSLP